MLSEKKTRKYTRADLIVRSYETETPNDYGPQGMDDDWFTQTERASKFMA